MGTRHVVHWSSRQWKIEQDSQARDKLIGAAIAGIVVGLLFGCISNIVGVSAGLMTVVRGVCDD